MKVHLYYTAVAALVAGATINLNNEIPMLGEFDDRMQNNVYQDVRDATKIRLPFERLTLRLSSPGGSVRVQDFVERVIREADMEINTLVTDYAASAAAETFTLGKERTMSKDAKILFHRVRILLGGNPFFPGDIAVTAKDVEDYLATGKATLNHSAAESEAIGKELDKISKEDLKTLLKDLLEIDSKMIANIAKNLGKTEEFVSTTIVPLNVDRWLSAQEAFDQGIATKIID